MYKYLIEFLRFKYIDILFFRSFDVKDFSCFFKFEDNEVIFLFFCYNIK